MSKSLTSSGGVSASTESEAGTRAGRLSHGAAAGPVMTVACHRNGVKITRAFGMRTAFVARLLEFGPDVVPATLFDFYTDDSLALAGALGV